MPICYGNSGGVGRFIKRVDQPLHGAACDDVDLGPKPVSASGSHRTQRLPVRCIDTGEVYESARAAGRVMALKEEGSNAANNGKEISRCCRHERLTWHGMRWEYVKDGKGPKNGDNR